MQPFKKQKVDNSVAADPFDDEDDWDDDDDILQLVANDVPTNSQMSQAVKASPSNKSRTFVFKRPSASAASVVASRPTRYVNSAVNETSAVVKALESTGNVTMPEVTNDSVLPSSSSKYDPLPGGSPSDRMADMVRKQHAHEGEIKWLRSTLQEKEKQINTMRTNFNAEKAKQKLQVSERERTFIKDIESLRSELQFKESELVGVTQTLDRLKREKLKPPPPSLKLDGDGFPVSSSDVPIAAKRSKVAVDLIKAEPMDTKESVTTAAETSCDLLPISGNRLVPRKLTIGEYQRKLLVSQTLKESLESVKCGLNMEVEDGKGKSEYHKLLTDCITCAKDLCYL